MNLLLLEPDELSVDGTAVLTGRRLAHAREVLAVQAGDTLRVGVIGGSVGTADVLSTGDALTLRVALTDPPPARPGVDLVLAIPRPKALKRIFPVIAQLGVDRVVLVNAVRVEKSYFDSAALAPETARRLLLDGLEQARDTMVPEILVRPRFRPFVEDELDTLFPSPTRRLLAHPHAPALARDAAPGVAPARSVVAIGPEGGWVPFEIDLLCTNGFTPFSLGPRVLRTETMVPYILGVLSG